MYTSHRPVFPDLKLRLGSILLVVLSVFCASAQAQKSTALPKKLPSAEKVVDNYLKAVGGKKIVGAIRDATYEWLIHFNNQPFGTAPLQLKAPSAAPWEMTFGNGQVISSSNASSAWEIGLNNQMRTLTGADGAVTKLQAALDASRLLNLKKSNIMARVVSLGDLASEPAYVVEFSTRG